MSEPDITVAEATELVYIMANNVGHIDGRKNRTEREQLALGVVFFNEWVANAKSQRTIAAQYGMSQAAVSRYINKAMDKYPPTSVAADRIRLIEMVDKRIEFCEQKAASGDDKYEGHLIKYIDQRAKLTAAYTPVEINANVVEESAADRELRELLAQQERENAVAKHNIEVGGKTDV